MANHGTTIAILNSRRTTKTFENVSHVTIKEGGCLQIWDTEGELIRTYGPAGWLYFDEVR